LLLLVAALAPIILALQPAYVDAQTQDAPSPRRTQNETQKEQMNAWTVGLAGGLLEGTPIRRCTLVDGYCPSLLHLIRYARRAPEVEEIRSNLAALYRGARSSHDPRKASAKKVLYGPRK
jgi:hypothetical protein